MAYHLDSPGFLDPIDNILQTGTLVMGKGSRKDQVSGKVCGPLPALTSNQVKKIYFI